MSGDEPSLWRQRDFAIAWSAGFVNDTGDWMLMVALPTHVFVETGSGSATALVFVCQMVVAAVLGPVGGAVVDRLDLKRCLVATNLAQAVALLPLLAVSADRLWPAYLVAVSQAVLTQVNNPANIAVIPRVVAPDRLVQANAALAGSSSVARLVGAPIGGVLVAWGGLGPVVAVDAATFVAVALALAFLRSDTSPLPDDDQRRPGVRAGVRAVRAHPPLGRLLSIHAVSQVAQGGFVVLFVAFMVEELGDDGSWLGVVRGTMAVGAVVGALVIGRLAKRVDPSTLYSAGLVGLGLVSAVFWNAPGVTTAMGVYVALFALSGVPGSAISVGLLTTIQRRSPRHVLGRAAGLLGTAEATGSAVGAIAAGLLIDSVSLRILLNAQWTVEVVAGIAAALLVAGASGRARSAVIRPTTGEPAAAAQRISG